MSEFEDLTRARRSIAAALEIAAWAKHHARESKALPEVLTALDTLNALHASLGKRIEALTPKTPPPPQYGSPLLGRLHANEKSRNLKTKHAHRNR